MPKLFTQGNHNFKSPNNCSDISPIPANLRENPVQSCSPNPAQPCEDIIGKRKIWGYQANCDPMQAGSIINDVTRQPNRETIYRYSNALRGCDQAMTELFKNILVLDEDGKPWPVPIMWGTQEKVVAAIMQNNVRKDNTLVVDRPTLPLLAIHQASCHFARERWVYHKAKTFIRPNNTELKDQDVVFSEARGMPVDVSYVLYAWTYYIEDMNQILEQIIPKFSPMAYIKVQGVNWEVGVIYDGEANNLDLEPGDQNERVIKYQFNMTAQTYIPQPITRQKTVLKIKTDLYNSVDPETTTDSYARIEVSADD